MKCLLIIEQIIEDELDGCTSSQAPAGVLVWAVSAIRNNVDGLQINPQNCFQFKKEAFFKQWNRSRSSAWSNAMMDVNAPLNVQKGFTAWSDNMSLKDDRKMTHFISQPTSDMTFIVKGNITTLWTSFWRLWLLPSWQRGSLQLLEGCLCVTSVTLQKQPY